MVKRVVSFLYVIVCSLQVFAQSLPSPHLDYSPPNSTVVVPFIFQWTGVQSAVRYCIQVSKDDGFMSDVVINQIITSTSYRVTSLEPGRYWWRVKAYGENDSSAWSEIWLVNVSSSSPRLSVTVSQTSLPYYGGVVQVQVMNTAGGTMDWTVQTTAPWLWMSKTAGVNNDSFYIIYDINRGEQRTGSIVITAPGATNSPLTIEFNQASKRPSGVWKQTNGPVGGTVTSIAYFKTNPLVLYLTTERSGIFRSLDTGKTWLKIGVCDTLLYQLEADDKRGRLYAANKGNFIYSTDGGNSWTRLSGSPYGAQAVAVDSSGNVYIGGGGGFPMQFQKSTDGGITWTSITSGLQNANSQCQALLAHPSGAIIAANANGAFVLPPNSTTWRSTNINFFVTSLRLGVDNRTVYAGTHNGFYISTDTGRTWVPRNTGLPGVYIGGFAVLSNGDVITSQETNEEQQGGIFRLAMNATSWERINPNIEGTIRTCVRAGGDIIILTTFNGRIYTSKDGGYTFTASDAGFIASTPVVLERIRDGSILTATGSTIWRTTNKGTTWDEVFNGTPHRINYINSISSSIATVFAATDGGVIRSNDYGQTWTIFKGQPSYQCSGILVVPPSRMTSLQVYVIVGATVYQSLDSGSTWTQLNSGLSSYSISSITRHFNGNILIGTKGDGVYQLDQSTNTWTKCSDGLSDQYITALIANSPFGSFPGAVYAATQKKIYAAFGSTIVKWEQVFDAPITFGPACLAVKNYNEVYCGTQYCGIYRSTNYGYNNSWLSYNDGFRNDIGYVYSLIVSGDNTGYAGIKNDGVYSTSGVTDITDLHTSIPTKVVLFQNYPNPFNPTTTIQFTVPTRTFVTLKIYDILGREIATLVNERKEPGSYSVDWDAKELGSGVYFYRLQTETFNQTRKLLLIK
ncbi:MAG: T9SS type A sorting domain-containing protein [Bacteroidetes bacterium]|nr:T9SS type A sorting domain-containing protein [Bacteroidota bacterium]